MEFTGKLINVSKDWNSQKWQVTFTVNEENQVSQVDNIKDCEKLNIKAVKHREKRSVDANAYAWVLLQKLAEANNTDRWSMYLICLQRYSRAFTFGIFTAKAVERVKQEWRTTIELGEVTVNGKTGVQLQMFYGSSTFDTKEMSVFIDGIVDECKRLGIETKTPEEIERMKQQWGI